MKLARQRNGYEAISIQELRTQLPRVYRSLEKGTSFILIRKSKPIAEIRPLRQSGSSPDTHALELFANPPKSLQLRTNKSATQLIREDRK